LEIRTNDTINQTIFLENAAFMATGKDTHSVFLCRSFNNDVVFLSQLLMNAFPSTTLWNNKL